MSARDIHSTKGKKILNKYLAVLQAYYTPSQQGGTRCGMAPTAASSPCFPDFDTTPYKNPCNALPLDAAHNSRGQS